MAKQIITGDEPYYPTPLSEYGYSETKGITIRHKFIMDAINSRRTHPDIVTTSEGHLMALVEEDWQTYLKIIN